MLVDRKAELAALSAMLAESARGIAGFAVVRGGTALGKTELLHSLRTRAAEHGFTVLTALGSPAEQPYPYALADQLFPELALHNEALATDGRDGTAVPPHVMRRLHCAALDLAAEQPLLLCVDDLQYADHASQQCLLYLIRRLRTARTAFVVTEAPHGTAHRTLLGELQYQPRIRRLTLAPLGASGVDRIVAGRLGEPAAERLAAGFHRLSGGNPLLLHALLDDTADAATPAPVPGDAYRAAALACVHRSGDDALAVARAVAVLGDSADNTDGSGTDVTTLLATVSGIAPRDVGPALDALTASALFHTGRPRHPVLAEALLADLSPTAHTALRAHAARALHARGAPAAAVAAQLLAGGPLGESWEAPLLRAAAEEHLAAGETAPAARCLRYAVLRADDSPRGLADRLATVAVAWRLDPRGVVPQLQALTGHARAGLLAPCTTLHLVRGLLWHGREDEAATAAEGLPAHADDPRYATELDVTRLRLATAYPGTLPRMPEVLRRTDPVPAARDEAPELLAIRTVHAALTGGDPDAVAAAAERVLRSAGLGDHRPEALVAAVQALVHIDRTATADAWCDRLLVRRDGPPTPVREAVLHQAKAFALLRGGDLGGAREYGTRALELMPEQGWGTGVAFPLAVLVEAYTAMGEHGAAAGLLDRPLPGAADRSLFGVQHRYAHGLHHLATGRPREALACFVSCGEALGAWGLDHPSPASWRVGAAEAWLALGRPEKAVRLLDDVLADPVHQGPRARAGALRVLAATEPPERRPATLARALELFDACDDRYGAARALAGLGRAHRELGDDAAARPLLARARDAALTCGATGLWRSLAPAARPAAGDDVLTGAEHRVASLAARGLSNREVAAELSIAVSTVEQHLTRIYRKYRIKHRRQLRDRMAPTGA